ncbi:SWIM zinc finger family protein [Oceanobacter kriegii]|uniref:SWIM zinc finger family protein n=1 Tax=Oceanobacter kriegii TaxID=64972 RepID=UPI00040822E0|nr:SWIM zinc finger family protein [Oceanobacter kriegii]
MNDDLLASLSSPGLVRRARKALDKASPVLAAGDSFEFEGQHGQINRDNPNLSQCDCAASGLCKHIIAVCLYVADNKSQTSDVGGLTSDVEVQKAGCQPWTPSLDIPALLKSAGKAKVRQLWKQSQKRWAYSIETQTDSTTKSGLVRVKIHQDEIHFRKAHDLGDLICHSQSESLRLLAVWLYCQQQQISFEWPDWLSAEQQQQAGISQQSQRWLGERIGHHLQHMLMQGIDQLRPSALLELEAMVIPMQRLGMNSAALKQLLSGLERYVSGRGIRDRSAILVSMAKLLVSLEQVQPEQLKPLQQAPQRLIGLGGYPWRNDSGAHGVTLILQDPQGQFVTLAESRATASPELNFQQTWHSGGWLDGAPSGSAWMGNIMALDNAELNGWNRLRRLQATHVYPPDAASVTSDQPFAPAEPISIDKVDDIDWQAEFLCFRPSACHSTEFDEASQTLTVQYADRDGHLLAFELISSSLSKPAIINLMALESHLPELIVARIERNHVRVHLTPCAVRLPHSVWPKPPKSRYQTQLHEPSAHDKESSAHKDEQNNPEQQPTRWFSLFFDTLESCYRPTRFSQWLAKLSSQPSQSGRTSRLQQLLIHCLDQLADQPPRASAHAELARRYEDIGLKTLARLLQSAKPLDQLRAAWCVNQLLEIATILPVASVSNPMERQGRTG